MLRTNNLILAFVFLTISSFAQKSKVQAAWRSLNDYEATVKDNPELSYLMKAKDNIEMALENEETKRSIKAHAYKCRIMYNIYIYDLKQEQKKLEATIQDKNIRTETAYGTVSLTSFNEACLMIEKIKDIDPKYYANIIEIAKNGSSTANEDDLKLGTVVMQLRSESANIAVGKYKLKEYDLAADYFYKSAELKSVMTGIKDTSGFYNACIAVQKSKNVSKIIDYNKRMIGQNIAMPYNYQTIYEALLSIKDTVHAIEYLRTGRGQYPNDVYLMNRETEIFLQKGNQEQALANLQAAIAREPANAQLYLVLGNVYDNLANPKGRSGKDTTKPADYDDLVNRAAVHYQKAIDLRPTNQDSYFNALYNLGALYNNYGGTLYAKAMQKTTIAELAKKQPEYEAKSKEYYRKAIPYLEQALAIKADDRATMSALRKLYLLTGNEGKAKEMGDKLK